MRSARRCRRGHIPDEVQAPRNRPFSGTALPRMVVDDGRSRSIVMGTGSHIPIWGVAPLLRSACVRVHDFIVGIVRREGFGPLLRLRRLASAFMSSVVIRTRWREGMLRLVEPGTCAPCRVRVGGWEQCGGGHPSCASCSRCRDREDREEVPCSRSRAPEVGWDPRRAVTISRVKKRLNPNCATGPNTTLSVRSSARPASCFPGRRTVGVVVPAHAVAISLVGCSSPYVPWHCRPFAVFASEDSTGRLMERSFDATRAKLYDGTST